MKVCMEWTKTDTTPTQGDCDHLVTLSNDYAASFDLEMSAPFTCKGVAGDIVTACATFKYEDGAAEYAKQAKENGLELYFKDRLPLVSQYKAENGEMVCVPAAIKVYSPEGFSYCFTPETLRSPCETKETGFPYCQCDPGAVSKTPYEVAYSRTYKRSGNNVYCFKVTVHGGCEGRCCNMNLEKVEMLTDEDKCLYSAENWWLSTEPNKMRSPTWSREVDAHDGKTYGVFKFNQINLPVKQVDGLELCVQLKKDSNCPTLQQFCWQGADYGCQYAIFDSPKACCASDFSDPLKDFPGTRRRLSFF